MPLKFDPSINPDDLAGELVRQAQLMWELGEAAATARAEMDQAKAALAVVAADLDAQIRECPSDFGYAKIVEASVAAAITSHAAHKAATAAWIAARHKSATYDAAVQALDHRKRALDGLVSLARMNYYADPPEDDRRRER